MLTASNSKMIIARKKNTIKGTIFGIILRFIQMLFPFIIRTVFIKTLGIEYLGLNSLFGSILQVLNLAELGVSSALVYSMYKPIAEDDKEKICQLMNLYKSYYKTIGFVILCLGLLLMPFIPKLIQGNIPSDINIYVLYIMNLVATVLSYWLFAYRNSLFTAHQRNDIISIISIVTNSLMYIVQIILLFSLKNYYYYLSATILFQILLNIVTAICSKKYYPEYSPIGQIPEDEKKTINKKIRDLFTTKIGGIVNHSADSIVISTFAGLKLLAIYQNYYYVTSAIMALFTIFFSSLTAGLGNYLITNNDENKKKLLYNINYIVFFVLNFCCCSLVCLYQPFMKLWVGEANLLPTEFVFLFALYLYAEIAPRTLIVFKDAGGIWESDRFRPLSSALFNLTLNIVLFQYIGLYGVILSTVLALMLVSYPWVICNINKYMFNIGIKNYLKNTFYYTFILIICLIVTYKTCSYLPLFNSLLLTLMYRLLICIIIPNLTFIVIFFKKEENKYFYGLIKQFFAKRFKNV